MCFRMRRFLLSISMRSLSITKISVFSPKWVSIEGRFQTAGPDVRAEVARFISAWEVSKNFQQKNKSYGPRQRFWACRGTCRTMRGKRCLGPLKLHMDVYKKSKFLPTNTSPRKWRNVKVMNQQRQCLTKLLPNMTPRQLPYSRVETLPAT